MHVYTDVVCPCLPLCHPSCTLQQCTIHLNVFSPRHTFLIVPQPAKQPDEDELPSDEDDGLPDHLSGDELTDKRYMGGHIPSRSFKYLQMSVGDGQNGNDLISFSIFPPFCFVFSSFFHASLLAFV